MALEHLLLANSRFESTTWTATGLGRRWGSGAGSVWPLGLAFLTRGGAGLLTVLAVRTAWGRPRGVQPGARHLSPCRLERIPADHVIRALSAWSITSKAVTALMTALWGVFAGVVRVRGALVAVGVLLWATPWLLPRWGGTSCGTAAVAARR